MPHPVADPTRLSGRRITAEDLLRIQIVGDPRPSPDGRLVAYVVTHVLPYAPATMASASPDPSLRNNRTRLD